MNDVEAPRPVSAPALAIPLYLITGVVAVVVLALLAYLAGLALVGLPMLVVVVPAAILWTAAGRLASLTPVVASSSGQPATR